MQNILKFSVLFYLLLCFTFPVSAKEILLKAEFFDEIATEVSSMKELHSDGKTIKRDKKAKELKEKMESKFQSGDILKSSENCKFQYESYDKGAGNINILCGDDHKFPAYFYSKGENGDWLKKENMTNLKIIEKIQEEDMKEFFGKLQIVYILNSKPNDDYDTWEFSLTVKILEVEKPKEEPTDQTK